MRGHRDSVRPTPAPLSSRGRNRRISPTLAGRTATHASEDNAGEILRFALDDRVWGLPDRNNVVTYRTKGLRRVVIGSGARRKVLREVVAARLQALVIQAEFGHEIGHLDGGHGCLEAFVARFGTGALDGLLDRVGRQHAEDYRDAGRERDAGDAF